MIKKIIIGLCLMIFVTGCDEEQYVYSLANDQKEIKELYDINEIVYCRGVEFSVTNIQEKTNKQDLGIEKGNKLVAITYKVKNTTDNEKGFYSSDFTVTSKNGEIIKSKPGVFTNMWDGDFFKGATLTTNGTKTGYFVYELDENDDDYIIQYQCSVSLSFKDIVVKVKK